MRPTAHRGVTLVELLVALAASAFVLVAVVAAVRAQQQAYHGGQRVREAQSAARNALLFLEQKLALAGYGVDPVLAFDFTGASATDGPPLYAGPCRTDASPCYKDRTDGSDEIVFFARNPNYWVPRSDGVPPPKGSTRGKAWDVYGFDAASDVVRIYARMGDTFLKGQILQGICDQGQGDRLFTVAAKVGPLPADKADQEIKLVAETNLANPYARQNAGSCTPTRVYQIDRYRFHVRPEPVGDGTFEPYLVLDQGVDVNGDGNVDEADETILAPGVEIMQVAYQFNLRDDATPALASVGLSPGTGISFATGAPNESIRIERALTGAADSTANRITRPDFTSSNEADAKFYSQASLFPYRFGPPLAPERTTNHQGNIRAVQVALVARSASIAPDGGWNVVPGPGSPVFNMNVTPAWIQASSTTSNGTDRYERVRLESTVHLSNMVARRLLYD